MKIREKWDLLAVLTGAFAVSLFDYIYEPGEQSTYVMILCSLILYLSIRKLILTRTYSTEYSCNFSLNIFFEDGGYLTCTRKNVSLPFAPVTGLWLYEVYLKEIDISFTSGQIADVTWNGTFFRCSIHCRTDENRKYELAWDLLHDG